MNDLALIPSKDEFAVIREYVKMAKETGHYKHLMKDGEDGQILLILLTAREFGIPLMSALNGGINIVKGKVELSVHMKTFKILQGGNKLKSWFSEDSRTCYVEGTRRDTGLKAIESFSWEDAKRAGLTARENWAKYPKEMLYARAMSRIANKLFPDVVGGLTYARGEIDPIAMEETDIEPIDREICTQEEAVDRTKLHMNGETVDLLELHVDLTALCALFPNEECPALFHDFVKLRAKDAKISVAKMYNRLASDLGSVEKEFHEWVGRLEKPLFEQVPEINSDSLDMMIFELFKLFPGEDAQFSEFVLEKAELAKVSSADMYVAMYNKMDSVEKRYTEWKEIKEKIEATESLMLPDGTPSGATITAGPGLRAP